MEQKVKLGSMIDILKIFKWIFVAVAFLGIRQMTTYRIGISNYTPGSSQIMMR